MSSVLLAMRELFRGRVLFNYVKARATFHLRYDIQLKQAIEHSCPPEPARRFVTLHGIPPFDSF